MVLVCADKISPRRRRNSEVEYPVASRRLRRRRQYVFFDFLYTYQVLT